jgi:hypothetical protein
MGEEIFQILYENEVLFNEHLHVKLNKELNFILDFDLSNDLDGELDMDLSSEITTFLELSYNP